MVNVLSFDDAVLCRILVGVGPTDSWLLASGGARLQIATANGHTPYSSIPVLRK
jgi:hypothetical protein